MRTSLLQDNLKNALELVSKSHAKKSTLPILETVRISTNNGRIALSTTRLDWAVTVNVGGRIEEDGAICVPFTTISKLTTALSPERIDLDTFINPKGWNLSVGCGATKTDIRCLDSLDFPILPALPEDNTTRFAVPVGKFVDAVKSVEFCALASDDHPVLKSVYLELLNNSLSLTTCDRHMLGHKEIEVISETAFNAVVPVDILNDACWVLNKALDKDETIHISLEEDRLFINGANIEIVILCRDGHFPDWRQIVPQNFASSAAVDPVAVQLALRRADAIMEKNHNTVTLEVAPSLLYLRAKSDEAEQTTVTDSVSDGTIVWKANRTQIAAVLAHLPDLKKYWTSVKFSFKGETQPLKIQPTKDTSLFYILMPMNER